MKPLFFIFGLGYTASFLVQELLKKGFEVVGTTRHPEKYGDNPIKGLKRIDFFDIHIKQYLSQASHVLITIPPDKALGDLVLHHYAPLFENHLNSASWIGYLSSTGVYGDYQGQWVDERSPCQATNASAVLRLDAEDAWCQLAKCCDLPLHIFRLAGIYGPKRNALERLMIGKPYSLYKKDQVFSRIHVDDIVAVLLASMKNKSPMSLYNVADDEPCSSHLLDAYAASLLNYPAPPLMSVEEASLSPMEKEFYSANRRVSNAKIKEDLLIHLKYPSFREGLTSIWNNHQKRK